MATFITSKNIGQTININDVQTSTSYWKYNHNGSDSSVFSSSPQTITVANANGEFTIISCLSDGTVSGNITSLNLSGGKDISNQITSFDGTGLSSLTFLHLGNNQLISFDGTTLTSLTTLFLSDNQITSFNGTGLSGLTNLSLTNNPLTTFIGGDMGLITSLDFRNSFGGWNITTLETFDGTGLSGLTGLNLTNNPLTTFIGGDMGLITELDFSGWNITTLETFDGTGLSDLTSLELQDNQLTSFNGTGLSSLTGLKLKDNPLTTFIGGDMGLITTLKFGVDGWNITTLETFDGTGLTSLNQLTLNNNQIVLLDVTPITNLSQLELTDNPITPQNWDSILSGLVGLGNEDGNLKVGTTQRTNASTSDYDTLISRNWVIDGTFEIYTPSTFITSKSIGEFINIDIETSEGFWKYFHDGVWSEVYDSGTYAGSFEIEVTAEDGEFTLTSCDDEGTISGDITYLDLNNNGLTEFDGTGLSGLTHLDLNSNGLTSFNGTDLTSLTGLNLAVNELTTFDGTDLSSLTTLDLAGNLLTGLDVSPMTSLTNLYFVGKEYGNPLTSAANDSILNQLEANGLENGVFETINWRTNAGTDDFNTLISRGWTIEGADLVSVVRKLRVKGIGQQNQ